MKKRYILLVEDDPDQSDFVVRALKRAFRKHHIHLVETEHQFHQELPQYAENPPDVAILDVILRWSDPRPDGVPPRPDDVRDGGIQQAGLRIEEILRSNPTTARVPVILYTVTNENHVSKHIEEANRQRQSSGHPLVQYLGKDPSVDNLVSAVRQHLV